MEFSQPSPTRISHSNTTMSRIDALFSSAPGWLLVQFDATAEAIAAPEKMLQADISNPGALLATLRPRTSSRR